MSSTLIQTWLKFLEESPRRSEPFIFWHSRQKWHSWSHEEFQHQVKVLALSLKDLGVESGDRIAIMAQTRKEWMALDLAIMTLGAVTVTIYPTQAIQEVEYILNDSACRIFILENETHLENWSRISKLCPSVRKVVLMDGQISSNEIMGWDRFIGGGLNSSGHGEDPFQYCLYHQTFDDLATIIYTSGTTGLPKGVALTHRQIMSEIRDVLSAIPLTFEDRSLTFLPLAHVLGRIETWGALLTHYQLAFADGIEHLSHRMTEIKPTFLIAVPRFFEKLQTEIGAAMSATPLIKPIFDKALQVGMEVSTYQQFHQPLPWSLLPQYWAAKKSIFDRVHERLGGRLKFAISGGAPLEPDLAKFFHALGILILEGYGLTETTAAITANTPLNYRFGSVGRPLPHVDLKIAEDGEILVKSDKVFSHYINLPDESTSVFKDGYFCTGDIGYIDSDGFLFITDRKKDLIKTSGGKYIAPQKLEEMLTKNSYIKQALIFGDKEKYIVALLALDAEQIKRYAYERGLSYPDYSSLIRHPQVRGLIRMIVAEVNNQLASHETIKNFDLLPHELTVESGELTPSLKVKRKFCSEKYKQEIKSLYA